MVDQDFKGVSEKFHVSLLSDEGHGSERVVCQIGLDGLFILSSDGKRVERKYPLNHISRWALRGSSLVLYTKTPVDVEERTVTLQSDDRTIRSALDTLTSCCMQMVELLQGSGENNSQTTNSLTTLINGGTSKKLPSAEDVEFWVNPEKAGWLQSQGEHIKTWRRRWFVLKQGYLFRFAGPDVTSSSKARGLVDLSKVTDVSAARDATGRNNSLMLSTPTGRVLYVADSETEQVEWLSALEGTVAKIVKQVAGVEDEPAPAAERPASVQNKWTQQLEQSYTAVGGSSSGRSSSARDPNAMVNIVGYNQEPTAPHTTRPSASYDAPDYNTGSSFGYDNIAGIAGIRTTGSAAPKPSSSSSFSDSFVKVDYPAYPVLAATASHQTQAAPTAQTSYADPTAATGSGYGHYTAPQQQQQQQQPQHHAYSGYQAPAQQDSYQQQPYGGGGGGTCSYQPQASQAHSYLQQAAYQPPRSDAAPGHPSWQELHADNGRPYYYNASTGVTQWEQPAGFV